MYPKYATIPTNSPATVVTIAVYIPADRSDSTIVLSPLLAIAKKACTIPITVPKNPSIGPPPAMVASRLSPFSSFPISRFPTFSMATNTSLIGRPNRLIPFSTIRAEGVLFCLQRLRAESIFASKM